MLVARLDTNWKIAERLSASLIGLLLAALLAPGSFAAKPDKNHQDCFVPGPADEPRIAKEAGGGAGWGGGGGGAGGGGGGGPGWWGLGVFVPVLPWYYTSFWWDGIPYYYGDNAYYVWDGDAGEYEQVNPPQGFNGVPPDAAANAAPMTSELYAYPKGGQSEAQQARDRTECRQWAAQQAAATSAPPAASGAPAAPASTSPPAAPQAAAAGALPSTVAAREGYLRAEAACLEARNYTVR